jgi:uncharacterized protein (TIGR01777 family)
MKIAITGSSGLIGTALRRSLEADGHAVVRVVRGATGSAARTEPGAVAWDPTGGTIDAGGLEGLDGVVHLAGAGIGDKRWSDERRLELVLSRTKGTALLAETLAGLDRPPPVLVSGSAIGYYGDRGDELLTEQSEPGDDFLARLCIDWEAATTPAADAGIRVTTIRTGLVLSTDGGALPKLLPLFRLGLGGRFGSGRQWWSWIDGADEVAAIRFLLEHDVRGPVNLTAPGPVTNAELTKVLGHVLSRPTVLPVPAFGPRLLLGKDLADSLLFTSARVQPAALEAAGFAFRQPELEAAFRTLLDRPA